MILKKERAAQRFRQTLFGILNVLEHFYAQFDEPTEVLDASVLLYLHFDQDARMLQTFLSNPDAVATFRQIFPHEHHYIDAATDLVTLLGQLHETRQQLISNHITPDRKMVRDTLENPRQYSLKDRGALRGLTESQQATYEQQLSKKGFMTLSMSERRELTDSIRGLFQALATKYN